MWYRTGFEGPTEPLQPDERLRLVFHGLDTFATVWIHDRTSWDWDDTTVPGSLYYHEVLPRVVAELDGETPYWPGSPYGGDDHNDRRQGNVHNREVWHVRRGTRDRRHERGKFPDNRDGRGGVALDALRRLRPK